MARAAYRSVVVTPRTDTGVPDPRYPTGVPPVSIEIVIAPIPDITLIDGATFSRNFSSTYASGAGLTGASHAIIPISGSSLATLGMAFAGTTLSSSDVNVGVGVFVYRITKSGSTIDSNQFSISVAMASTDTLPPNIPLGIGLTVSPTFVPTLTGDWPADVRTAAVTSSNPPKVEISSRVNGGAYSVLTTLTAGGDQPCPVMTGTAIGGATLATFSQTGADITISGVVDGVMSDTEDKCNFYWGLCSNPIIEIGCTLPSYTSDYQWTVFGPCIRQSLDLLAPSLTVLHRPVIPGKGAPVAIRATQGGTLTYTPDAIAPVNTDVKLVVNRSGSSITRHEPPVTIPNNSFGYFQWNASSKLWTLISSGSFTVTGPVPVGFAFARTVAGSAVLATAVKTQLNVLGQWSHTGSALTQSTSDRTYDFRVRSFDSALTPNASAYSDLLTTVIPASTPAPGGVKRLNTGCYVQLATVGRPNNIATVLAQWISDIRALAADTSIIGVSVFAQWKLFEGDTIGDYGTNVFSTVGTDAAINAAAIAAGGKGIMQRLLDVCQVAGKQLAVCVMHQMFGSYGSYPYANYIPKYIVDTYGVVGRTAPDILYTKYWEAGTMDRIIAKYAGYCATFNNHPNFEFFAGAESAVTLSSSGPSATPGFSNANVATQLKRLVSAAASFSPNAGFRCTLNFLGDDAMCQDLVDHCVANKAIIGGPDCIPHEDIQANGLYAGPSHGGTNLGHTDYRGRGCWISECQDPEMGGKDGNFQPNDFWQQVMYGGNWQKRQADGSFAGATFANFTMKPSYFMISQKTYDQYANDGDPATVSSTWLGTAPWGIRAFLRSATASVYLYPNRPTDY